MRNTDWGSCVEERSVLRWPNKQQLDNGNRLMAAARNSV